MSEKVDYFFADLDMHLGTGKSVLQALVATVEDYQEVWHVDDDRTSEDAPEKLIKYSEVIQLLSTEQDWSRDHIEDAMAGGFTREYLDGFLAGMDQAKHLITAITHLDSESSHSLKVIK